VEKLQHGEKFKKKFLKINPEIMKENEVLKLQNFFKIHLKFKSLCK